MKKIGGILLMATGVWPIIAAPAVAQSPFASSVVEYIPAPGQFVTDSLFNNPAKALGRPFGNGFEDPGNSSLVTLGGFGGTLVLGFEQTIWDDPANPFGLDAIIYGNAFWVSGNPNRKWAECGHLEISRDINENGAADDPWYLIPGSHITDLASQFEEQVWDDDIADSTYPPADASWLPPGASGTWSTSGYALPLDIFGAMVLENPLGLDAEDEAIFGYADTSPTLTLGDLDGDGAVEDPAVLPEVFYTRPDHPFKVGLTPGCGGGDGFDIAWAIDPATGLPAGLEGFDFVRITTAVNVVSPGMPLGEKSTEIDAVADVAEGEFGDAENDGDVDFADFAIFAACLLGPQEPIPPSPCRVMDFAQDSDLDLDDFADFQAAFTGP